MKKLVCAVITLAVLSSQAFAADTANIKIKINATGNDNTYYLCMPNLGCLSLLAAQRGKVFPSLNPVEMNTMFVTNIHNMRVYNQGLPKSCDVTVKPNQTITIYGSLSTQTTNVHVQNLRCVVS